MDDMENSLPDTINPNIFPAKLWRLVNSPAVEAVFWDSHGELLVVDQQLLERQVLSPGGSDGFKTRSYSSFVRQLNLYGFRKAEPPPDRRVTADGRSCHYFYNPNFNRNRHELLANLRRLTVENKSKLRAGLDVSCRLVNRHRQGSSWDSRDRALKIRGSSPLRLAVLQSVQLPRPDPVRVLKPLSGTPVPPRYLVRGHGGLVVPSPVFAPVSLNHLSSGGASISSTTQVQQELLSQGSDGRPPLSQFSPQSVHYQAGCYPSVCRCYSLGTVPPTVSHLQTGSLAPQRCYQAGYPVSTFDLDQDLRRTEHQEVKSPDISLNAVFQMADQVMRTAPEAHLVEVKPPEETVGVSDPSLDAFRAAALETSATPADVSDVPKSKQVPEGATFEVKGAENTITGVSNAV
ncbi:heat shock factor protein 5 [Kryptolebias marmoratus]|uniref:heat shock factor protein 5 n=1 Tax=Kryptolebias marmoratus TaxID=37003 RepID=UPI000D530E7C|nr:heat shock factor protein 5 [Kryptolebias marmoratus]